MTKAIYKGHFSGGLTVSQGGSMTIKTVSVVAVGRSGARAVAESFNLILWFEAEWGRGRHTDRQTDTLRDWA